MLLETWIDIEIGFGGLDSAQVADVKEKLPIKVKKRRPLAAVAGGAADPDETVAAIEEKVGDGDVDMTGWEEFYDYVFPDDEKSG